MSARNLWVAIGIVIALFVSAFVYRAWSVDLQEKKELRVIQAQEEKEETILEVQQQQEAQEKLTNQISSEVCLRDAKKQREKGREILLQMIIPDFQSGIKYSDEEMIGAIQNYCWNPNLTVVTECLKGVNEYLADINTEFETAEDKCYQRFK